MLLLFNKFLLYHNITLPGSIDKIGKQEAPYFFKDNIGIAESLSGYYNDTSPLTTVGIVLERHKLIWQLTGAELTIVRTALDMIHVNNLLT